VPNDFWRDWTAAIKREFPQFRVFGEVKDGDVTHVSFFQGGRVRFDGVDSGLDSLLDFPLFYPARHAFASGKPVKDIAQLLAKDYLYTNPDLLVTLIGSHDDGRFMSEPGATVAGLKLAHTLLLTTRGVPQIYYGDEIAMTGADEPTTRQDFPGGFPGDRRNAFTRAGRTAEEQDIFEHTRRMARLRAELEPLRRGALVTLHAAAQQYAYARVAEGAGRSSAVIVVFNNDTKPATLEFDVAPARVANDATLDDRLDTLRNVRVQGGKLKLTLPARSASILTNTPAR
jgi:glycosidase